jgi:urease accessory protein
VIRAGGGWQDAVLIGLALRPGADLDALASTARALAPSAERLRETEEQGAAFARMVAGVTARSLPAEPLPIAIARAVLPLGLPAEDAIALAVQAFATNLVQIGIRAIPLGQTEGQAILSRLLPTIGAVAARAAQAEDDDLGAASLAADLHSIRHETQEVRLWKT